MSEIAHYPIEVEESEAERLAELYWISYTMTARIAAPTPMWDDLDAKQRSSFVTAMKLMLELGHLSIPGDEPDSCCGLPNCPDCRPENFTPKDATNA